MDPPQDKPYTAHKAALKNRLSTSKEQEIRRLLEKEEIGDSKPSQFLHRLRALAGTGVSESLLHTLWTGHLPSSVQGMLATQKNSSLDDVAELADAILESTTPNLQVHQVSRDDKTNGERIVRLEQHILAITNDLAALRIERRQFERSEAPRSRYPSRNRSQSRSGNRSRDNGQCWYHRRFADKARMCRAPCGALFAAPCGTVRETRAVVDGSQQHMPIAAPTIQFLIDTSADLCVYPRKLVRSRRPKSTHELIAANGTITIKLNFQLRRSFSWQFVIADVSKSIIGVDFLSHYGLLVDVRNQRLLDETTRLTSPGVVAGSTVPSITTIAGGWTAGESVIHR
ncbi:hypothetical protein NQ315_014781 [Exocentrus adspersus]|uniref:Peptidase A2 domain-containing protein n=1 Tax=Exocentrus adspersus TaxID=1586481 RepID=A0AAV8VLW5_9CUCU|nr:hypothetical protein NQ315_014781 [Exocentrus adspersus]